MNLRRHFSETTAIQGSFEAFFSTLTENDLTDTIIFVQEDIGGMTRWIGRSVLGYRHRTMIAHSDLDKAKEIAEAVGYTPYSMQ